MNWLKEIPAHNWIDLALLCTLPCSVIVMGLLGLIDWLIQRQTIKFWSQSDDS